MSINEAQFGKAMTAALDGPEKKKVKFRNHDFHIRPIKRTPNGNGVHVDGHLFHQLTARPDDKILYSFDLVNGRTQNLEIRFEKGIDKLVKAVREAVEIASVVIKTVGEAGDNADALPGSIPRSKPATDTLKLLADDGWKAESRFLIANIAVRVR
jgi:hypothetical protein